MKAVRVNRFLAPVSASSSQPTKYPRQSRKPASTELHASCYSENTPSIIIAPLHSKHNHAGHEPFERLGRRYVCDGGEAGKRGEGRDRNGGREGRGLVVAWYLSSGGGGKKKEGGGHERMP